MLDSLNGVYCSMKPLAEAKQDPNHPLYYVAKNAFVNGHFVKALHEMYSQFAIFTDFFDMQHNWQVLKNQLRCFRKFLFEIISGRRIYSNGSTY